MSEFSRLKRVIQSWTGRLKSHRQMDYEHDDARMILNNLALQFRPETLAWMLEGDVRKEDFLHAIYAAEEELDVDMVKDNTEIDPVLNPQAYELDGQLIFTVTLDGEEIIFGEFKLPPALAEGTWVPREETAENSSSNAGNQPGKSDGGKPASKAIDIDIE